MSHVMYQTPAIILATRNIKESNKLGILYTRDFGLIYVNAQSIRSVKAKMKSQFLSLSFVEVDLIQGRNMWKLTGIEERYSALNFASTQWYPVVSRITSLVKRLCQGEEENIELWNHLKDFYERIKQGYDNPKNLELIMVLRILKSLGYWSDENPAILADDIDTHEVTSFISQNKTSLTREVNDVLRMTQL